MEVKTRCFCCSTFNSQQNNTTTYASVSIFLQRCHEPLYGRCLTIITFVHLVAGGSFPFTIGRIEHGHKVRPDLCAVDNKISPRKYLGSFFTDSLVHDPVALKLLIDIIGKVSLFSFIESTDMHTKDIQKTQRKYCWRMCGTFL